MSTIRVNGGLVVTAVDSAFNTATTWGVTPYSVAARPRPLPPINAAAKRLFSEAIEAGGNAGYSPLNSTQWSAPDTAVTQITEVVSGRSVPTGVRFTATNGVMPVVVTTGGWATVTYSSANLPTVSSLASLPPTDEIAWSLIPVSYGTQPFPGISPINLIVQAVRPNGEKHIIIGSPTTLKRFNAVTNTWDTIGDGFDPNGSRWEAVSINGWLVLNNASDLPMTFRLEDSAVVPMYELRDNGIASVGSIAELNGVLQIMDLREIPNNGDLLTWMNDAPDPYGRYTPDGSVSNVDGLDRFGFRVAWSALDAPRRFDAAVPCATTLGSPVITMAWAAKSFSVGQEMIVLGAGAVGGNLVGNILEINGTQITLDTPALTSEPDSTIQALDSISSIVGFQDLQDDGSTILKALELRGSLVIYKETSVFLMTYTGAIDAPYSFQRLQARSNQAGGGYKGKALYYRHTLVSVTSVRGDTYHMYAGRDSFYRFDLVTRSPTEIGEAEVCRDIFFDAATQENKELIYVSDNSLTHELFFCFPSETDDKALRYDYKYGTFSTTSLAITAAGTVDRPDGMDVWFVMGTNEGVVLIYGLVREGLPQWDNAKEIFYRRTLTPYENEPEEYVSSLLFGYLGSGDGETEVSGYTLSLSSKSPDAPVRVNWVGWTDATGTEQGYQDLGGQEFASPANQYHVGVWFLDTFIQEEITVRTVGSKVILQSRTYYASGVQSMGANQVVGTPVALASSSAPASSS